MHIFNIFFILPIDTPLLRYYNGIRFTRWGEQAKTSPQQTVDKMKIAWYDTRPLKG